MKSRRFEDMAIKMPDIHRDMLVSSIGLFKIINRLKKLAFTCTKHVRQKRNKDLYNIRVTSLVFCSRCTSFFWKGITLWSLLYTGVVTIWLLSQV
jgi:hypothetical protein